MKTTPINAEIVIHQPKYERINTQGNSAQGNTSDDAAGGKMADQSCQNSFKNLRMSEFAQTLAIDKEDERNSNIMIDENHADYQIVTPDYDLSMDHERLQ